MDRLAHRGPDGEGFWTLTNTGGTLVDNSLRDENSLVVLGHRRLSIVDIEGGAQPMTNEDGSLWVSFNGEIYNQLELRRVLEHHGHRFRTTCDTEVLLHGWEEWGEEMFGRLNGIFALALANGPSGEVVLARDPLGVKPLYVGTSRERTWWASELGAAVEAGLTKGAMSPDALKLFLTFRFVPSPWSIYEDVWKIPPGHFVRIQPSAAGNLPAFRPYRAYVRSTASPRTTADWREAIGSELEGAVKRQLMADVPLASLLSGGVDSSLVTLLMTRHLAYAPQTYGIGFVEDRSHSEAVAASVAAAVLGVPHGSIDVSATEYIAQWPSAFRRTGEPLANSGGLLVELLCRRVSGAHKVVLTGQGADEPLGGYPRHVVERLYRAGRLAPHVADHLLRRAWGDENARRFARALAAPSRVDRYAEIFAVFPSEVVDRYVLGGTGTTRELARAAISRWMEDDDSTDGVNQLLRVDSRMSLADDLLLVADRFSMSQSVELRVPFLDLEFVELVERMPSRYKISPIGSRKWLYRQAAARRLPRELAHVTGLRSRIGRKRGFSTPLDAWFTGATAPLADPAAWGIPIAEVPALSPALVSSLDGDVPSAFATSRHRAVLYALAMWLHGGYAASAKS
jgi:asparagine synthase (glutamine-hydrolysing)